MTLRHPISVCSATSNVQRWRMCHLSACRRTCCAWLPHHSAQSPSSCLRTSICSNTDANRDTAAAASLCTDGSVMGASRSEGAKAFVQHGLSPLQRRGRSAHDVAAAAVQAFHGPVEAVVRDRLSVVLARVGLEELLGEVIQGLE